jgi:two-component system NtrC family sensor kinase
VRWSAILVSDSEHGVFSTFTFHDLRPELHLERIEARMRHADRLSLLGQVFGGIAHEIRNPLGHIMMGAELLAMEADPEKRARQAERIKVSAERCQEILARVLGFVRRSPAAMSRQSILEPVQEVLEFVRRPFALDSVQLELEVQGVLENPVVDKGKLQQVLINLLQNARDALQPGDRGGTIRIELGNQGPDAVYLQVSDDGPGIPPELLGRVSEAFFTTKPEGQGTGLGLAVCRSLVEEHGGTLSLTPRSPHGLAVRVVLPLRPPVRTTSSAPPHPAGPGLGSSPPSRATDLLDGLQVLVVDDDPDWLDALRRGFATLGAARIDQARDAGDALMLMGRQSYGLVVCDVRLPVVSGPTLFEIARKAFPETARRFLFLTGFPDDQHLARLTAFEQVARLGKPCDLVGLHDAALRVLTRLEPGSRAPRDAGPPPTM